MPNPGRVWSGLLVLALVGCAYQASSPQSRRDSVDSLATASGWQQLRLPTETFVLTAYVPAQIIPDRNLTIYIEGDGLAWTSKSRLSSDPTPQDPIGLKLALRHPRGSAAYLARPCQYVMGADAHDCTNTYWSQRRFAPEVIAASNQAIDELKQRFAADRLVLVGYSGGGAVAALVAARREDVSALITVAGNLDHRAWSQLHHVTPLEGSLNPADAWQALTAIPQLHLVGQQDNNVGPEIAESYRQRFPAKQRPEIRIIADFDHTCCWVDRWAELVGGWISQPRASH